MDELAAEINEYRKTKDELIEYFKSEIENSWSVWDIYSELRDKNKHLSWSEIHALPEYIDAVKKYTDRELKMFTDEINDMTIFAVVEHGDGGEGEDGILEQEILPRFSNTVKRFSHR